MEGAKVVLWRPMYDPAGHAMLRDQGADVVIVDSSDASELKQVLHGARATPERVTADVLEAGKDLIVVHRSIVAGFCGFVFTSDLLRSRHAVAPGCAGRFSFFMFAGSDPRDCDSHADHVRMGGQRIDRLCA